MHQRPPLWQSSMFCEPPGPQEFGGLSSAWMAGEFGLSVAWQPAMPKRLATRHIESNAVRMTVLLSAQRRPLLQSSISAEPPDPQEFGGLSIACIAPEFDPPDWQAERPAMLEIKASERKKIRMVVLLSLPQIPV
ncbi:MAG: hypothetical protein J0H11_14350 [Rhizobiales bacterium]|nr:hypothetical protein [Hyphomicrobiales bacterium]